MAKSKGIGRTAAAQKAAAAMHAKYPKGKQSASQLSAERANLAIARGDLASQRGNLAASVSVDIKGVSLVTEGAKLGAKASLRVRNNPGAVGTHHALGTRHVAVKLGRTKMPSKYKKLLGVNALHKPTGIWKKVPKRVAPGSFDSRTGWRKSRATHIRHHLRMRKKRPTVIKHWRRHRKSIRPR